MERNISASIIEEVNRIRLNPKTYARKLRSYINHFEDNVLRLPQYKNGIIFNEGAVAFQDAANYLDSLPKLKTLITDDALSQAAETLVNEMTLYNDFSSMNKINRQQIIGDYGVYEGEFGQSTDFGSQTSELVVMNLIVDDGDSQRRNRKMLFNEKFTKIGCASCAHPTFHACSVLLFAFRFIANTGGCKGERKVKRMGVVDNNKEEEDEMGLPQGVVKMDKKEKIINEDGKKMKITKVVMYREDGEINTQLYKTEI